jgi:hypothetical protein
MGFNTSFIIIKKLIVEKRCKSRSPLFHCQNKADVRSDGAPQNTLKPQCSSGFRRKQKKFHQHPNGTLVEL